MQISVISQNAQLLLFKFPISPLQPLLFPEPVQSGTTSTSQMAPVFMIAYVSAVSDCYCQLQMESLPATAKIIELQSYK